MGKSERQGPVALALAEAPFRAHRVLTSVGSGVCRWAIACLAALKDAPWSESLLAHELAEPLHAAAGAGHSFSQAGGAGAASGGPDDLLYRGLRVKV